MERLSAKGRGRSAPCSPQGEGAGGGQTYVHSWREGSSHVCVTGKPGRHPAARPAVGFVQLLGGPTRGGWSSQWLERPAGLLLLPVRWPGGQRCGRAVLSAQLCSCPRPGREPGPPGLPQPLAELSRCRAKAGATHHHVSHAPRAAPPEGLVCPEFTLTSERFPANTPWLTCATAS